MSTNVFYPPAAGTSRTCGATPEVAAAFRQRALSAGYKDKSSAKQRHSVSSNPDVQVRKTRSQTKSQSSSIPIGNGDVVFAFKGKKVPFWWPGKVVKVLKRGFKIDFYFEFGTED